MLKVQPLIEKIETSNLKASEKESAITALMRIENNRGANFSDEFDLLSEAFLWERTMEGFDFWQKVHQRIEL